VARGTKTEYKPGYWRLRVYVGDDPATGRPVQRSRNVRGGVGVAERELSRFIAELERGEVSAAPAVRQTVGELLDAWLDLVGPQRSPTSVRGYRDKVNRWKRAVGAVPVAKLTARDLDLVYARWLAEGLSPTTVRHCHRVLAVALKQAQRWGQVQRCVTDLATPPAPVLREVGDLDPAAWQAVILDLLQREPVTAMAVLLAGVTGARRGELCGLRWTDIDWDRRLVVIARSIRHDLDKRRLVVAPTKTGQVRRLSLDARTLELLAGYHAQAEGWAAEAGTELADDGFVLSRDPSGRSPLKPDTITAGFTRSTRRVGVTLRFHDLRHMSASLLIAGGTDVRTVANRLGHADASTTLRIYAHAFEAQDRRAAEVMGALLPG
jgi:integrase